MVRLGDGAGSGVGGGLCGSLPLQAHKCSFDCCCCFPVPRHPVGALM